jgi:hypothetical protein
MFKTIFDIFRYVFFFVSLFGSILQLTNIIILCSIKWTCSSYKYMLANSINNFLYLIGSVIFNIAWCGFTCDYMTEDFIYIIYKYVIVDYLTSCMAIFNILIQIYLTIQRLFLVLNRKFTYQLNTIYVFAILIFISLLFYSPMLFIQQVNITEGSNFSNNTNKTISYSIVPSDLGKTIFGKTMLVVMPVLRIGLATIVLPVLNIIKLIFFRKYFQRKHMVLKSDISNIQTGKIFQNLIHLI